MEVYCIEDKRIVDNSMDRVAIIKIHPNYPPPPFSPHIRYPEYGFDDLSTEENWVYDGVRRLFVFLELDKENFAKKEWNPLKFIRPGDTVLIKPNMVSSIHFDGGEVLSVYTHASFLRSIIDFVLIALHQKGRIIVADSPERMADFDSILEKSGIKSLIDYYSRHEINIEVRDLRPEKIRYGLGAIVERRKLPGDPEGYTTVDIGEHSAFFELPKYRSTRLYGADYNIRETLSHHHEDKNEYEISNSILKADVIISVPKLKTHYKAGVTLNLKGLIGCTGNKNLVPHRTLGDPSNGGDSYPFPPKTGRGLILRKAKDTLQHNLLGVAENRGTAILNYAILGILKISLRPPKDDLRYGGGQWCGNDTLWRSVVDVARIIMYADKTGKLCDLPQRVFFSVIDGVYAGDKNGPIRPRLRKEGVILGGFSPVEVDIAGTHLMGLDYKKILYLKKALEKHRYDLSIDPVKIEIVSNEKRFEKLFKLRRDETLCFEPAEQWKGTIELKTRKQVSS